MSPEAQAALEALQKIHNDVQVTQIQDWTFIWRPLTRLEYRNVRKMGFDPGTEEELICALCVLWPEDYDWHNPVKAGHPTSVCYAILTYSGFVGWDETQQLLHEYEQELQYFDGFMDPVICAAFPSIRPEEPQTWTRKHALWVFARAKWILERVHGLRVDIMPPQQMPQGAAAPAQAVIPPSSPPVIKSTDPEARMWPEDLFFEDDEEIPDIPGFPKVK